VSTPQYDATLRAVASLDFSMHGILSPGHPEPRGPGWTPELTDRVVDAMRACRWFLATGFDPPRQFGPWLRATLEAGGVAPGSALEDWHGSVAWKAAGAVDRLCEEWRPEWSM
jgi:hypothetical protein